MRDAGMSGSHDVTEWSHLESSMAQTRRCHEILVSFSTKLLNITTAVFNTRIYKK
jgi:hypothetical protein